VTASGRVDRVRSSPVWAAGVAAGASILAYAPFYGRRNDYPGHFAAGLGGTLLLLIAVGLLSRRPLGWWAVAVMIGAVGLGAVAEATVFRYAVFDPVDFFNQSLGAAVATLAVLDAQISGRSAVNAAALSLCLLGLGFLLAFS
jgi:hypothetical protein